MHTGLPTQANRILIRYGEIALKGRNRSDFEEALHHNIRHKLACIGLRWPVRRTHDRIYIEIATDPGQPLDKILNEINEISGIVSLAPAVFLAASLVGQRTNSPDFGLIEKRLIELARQCHISEGCFAVQVNRADKRFPATSQQLAQRFGSAILEQSDWKKVRLTRPDQTFFVDIYKEGVYLYTEKIQGIGGLPVGPGGRVLSLLSGGIDSPVASYLMARRGCQVDFIHMTATQVQQTSAQTDLICRLARQISRFTLHSRLFLVPYIHFDLALLDRQTGYELILLRRFMARTAQALAAAIGAQALVTGDSLGQVASQTLENMVTNSRSVELPILRPLISYDKQEIIALARKIGTYETSIQPYKDCCALVSQNPRTKSSHDQVTALENQLLPDYPQLIAATLNDTVSLEFDCGEPLS